MVGPAIDGQSGVVVCGNGIHHILIDIEALSNSHALLNHHVNVIPLMSRIKIIIKRKYRCL